MRSLNLRCSLGLLMLAGLALLCCSCPPAYAQPRPLASLQSYTGLWNMPNARVLPDWHLRLGYGRAEPYRYYGGALGLFDRLEFHGQFTEISSIEAFEDFDYGHYKDRSAGARLVLWQENELFPQVAIGAFDATGTAFFPQRYLVTSKRLGKFDFTLGLGQGILGGEYFRDTSSSNSDRALGFLLSGPNRKTSVFGGFEYQMAPKWVLAAEYSSIDRKNMFGYRDDSGAIVKDPSAPWPVNVGIKYHGENLQANLAVLRGDTIAAGIQVAFPMQLGSTLGWKKTPKLNPGASLAYRARHADNDALARIIAEQLKMQGFAEVGAVCSDTAIWVEFANSRHLEVARAFGHVADTVDAIAPARIQTLYLNQAEHQQVVQSFKLPRESFRAFMEQRLDAKSLLAMADLSLYQFDNWRDFSHSEKVGKFQQAELDRFSYSLQPRIQTFLNNRAGFFKHKGVLELDAGVRLWRGARLSSGVEFVVFNQFEDLVWERLEEEAVRTDAVEYQRQSDPRLTELAFEQHWQFPGQIQNRFAVGYFERAFAGFGYENFRFFNDGLWGVGLETELVRKRDVNDNFKLRDEPGMDKWFYTGFINLYAQIWPSQGLQGGLKIGRFLAGDPGVRIELQRSFKYFTVGAWYTKTDTSIFRSDENRDAEAKGVFLRFPLAVLKDRDLPGYLRYSITSFTRDQGQTVNQPSRLYPIDPWNTPVQTERQLNKMRQY